MTLSDWMAKFWPTALEWFRTQVDPKRLIASGKTSKDTFKVSHPGLNAKIDGREYRIHYSMEIQIVPLDAPEPRFVSEELDKAVESANAIIPQQKPE